MKNLILSIAILIPNLTLATAPQLEYELIRTPEAPGFFSVTIYPTPNSTPLNQRYTFVRNFDKSEAKNYQPVIDFLTEIGASVINYKPSDTQYVTLGKAFDKEKNFQTKSDNSLEEFENFTLINLQPTYLQNLEANFGGNISDVYQTDNNLSGDHGITFIGKFKKEMKTRMAITAQEESKYIKFDIPLTLNDKNISNSHIATQLPNLWEDLQPKPLVTSNNLIELFPWILAGLGLLILAIVFTRRTKRKYYEFLEEQDKLQEELPWQQISQKETTPTNPFEVS